MTLQGLHRVGEDGLANLFDVNIGTGFPLPVGIPMGDLPFDGGSFLRVESVTMPEPTINTYDVHFKSLDIERISSKMERPKEFTMTVRNDRLYVIYKFFTSWRNMAHDVTTGAMGDDGKFFGTSSSFRAPITISPCDVLKGENGEQDEATFIVDNAGKATNWVFYGCFPKSVGAITYDYSDGEKITFDVTMGFLEMREFLT